MVLHTHSYLLLSTSVLVSHQQFHIPIPENISSLTFKVEELGLEMFKIY